MLDGGGAGGAGSGALPDLRAYVLDWRLEPASGGGSGRVLVGGRACAGSGTGGADGGRFVPDALAGAWRAALQDG